MTSITFILATVCYQWATMPVAEKIMVMCIPWQETRYSVFTGTQGMS